MNLANDAKSFTNFWSFTSRAAVVVLMSMRDHVFLGLLYKSTPGSDGNTPASIAKFSEGE